VKGVFGEVLLTRRRYGRNQQAKGIGSYRHVGNLKYIDSDGMLHDNPSKWERLTHGLTGEVSHIFNSLGQTRSGFASLIPDAIVDHVPTLYATHLWNNIP
jgi:hypothetical protein